MFNKREFYFNKIISAFKVVPIVILIGARQVGKTTLMKNIPLEGKSLLLNGQDPETSEIFRKFSTLESYLKIKLNSFLKGYLLIDEFSLSFEEYLQFSNIGLNETYPRHQL